MQINGPAHVHGPQAISGPHRTNSAKPSAEASRPSEVDQLDISPEADMVARARELPDVRADRVAELKAAIANGTYETAEKLDGALDRLLDEIA